MSQKFSEIRRSLWKKIKLVFNFYSFRTIFKKNIKGCKLLSWTSAIDEKSIYKIKGYTTKITHYRSSIFYTFVCNNFIYFLIKNVIKTRNMENFF